MALLGTGIIPSGAIGNELAAITRRAFIPKLIVQIYQATPVLSALLSNAQTASGGISSVTVPVQGTPLVTAQPTDYSGAFTQPTDVASIQDAEYNLKALVIPIPFMGFEGLVQLSAAVIPKIEAKMNDAGNQAAAYLATQLATNATNGTINIDGFPLMADTATTYGNIDPTANTWWVGKEISASGNPTRASVLTNIIAGMAHNGGEMPNFGVCSPGTWSLLAEDFLGLEQYVRQTGSGMQPTTQGVESGFLALSVAGVPIYMDANFTDGEFYFGNTRYLSAYIHEAAAFSFTGFASTLPNFNLGYIGCIVAVMEMILVKRKAMCRVTGYSSNTL